MSMKKAFDAASAAMDIAQLSTDSDELRKRFMDPCRLGSETDWWARRRIEELEQQLDTAWAQAHRLALELECLIMDTKDNAIVSKWWDSAFEAMEEYHNLKPGAAEDAEAWAKMRKAGI
jgi:hypothetical protein